jgi:ABC-2 type transport system permease protein
MFHHHLRNELWKLFGKKRTYIGFGAFLLAQTGMLLMFRFGHDARARMAAQLAGGGYLAEEYISALSVAFVMLFPQVGLLMPLYAALVGGDLVAKEAEDGTLRMILCRPISRFRLLLVKWLAGVVFAIALVSVLGGTALSLARVSFHWGGMFVSFPPAGIPFSVLSPGAGFGRYFWSIGFMAINASTILAIAFMFSCFNMKPAAATILSLSVLFVSLVLENIPFFESYREWFPTFHFHNWARVYSQPLQWPQIAGSGAVLLALNLTAFLVGAAAFQARDIKS